MKRQRYLDDYDKGVQSATYRRKLPQAWYATKDEQKRHIRLYNKAINDGRRDLRKKHWRHIQDYERKLFRIERGGDE